MVYKNKNQSHIEMNGQKTDAKCLVWRHFNRVRSKEDAAPPTNVQISELIHKQSIEEQTPPKSVKVIDHPFSS